MNDGTCSLRRVKAFGAVSTDIVNFFGGAAFTDILHFPARVLVIEASGAAIGQRR